jgi:esterase/lipase superfamily enzyme
VTQSPPREIPKTTTTIASKHHGKDVLCARWGWYGTPVLLFPTAGGDAEEVERFKMMVVLRPLLEAGRIKVYSCDSVAGQTLTKRDRTPAEFAREQDRFDRFIAQELVPWIHADCETKDVGIVTAGASIGAFEAVAALCRHPDLFVKAICMSGTYDLTKWLDGPMGLDFYYSSPMHFLPGLAEDSEQLRLLRTRFVAIIHGQGRAEEPAQSWRLAKILGAKGIPNRVDEYGPDLHHDWVSWRQWLPEYLGRLA